MTDYIPKLATIEQSCEWLRARLGGVWILQRLLECHLKPYFWIDYKPGHPQIFGGKVEGYLTWMVFASDVHRLEADGTNALVNMFTAHDGTLVKIEPGWTVPLSELRFKREALERVASILEGEVSRQNPAPSGTLESDSHQEKPWISSVDRDDTKGKVAWQADIIENKAEILKKYGNGVSARDLMSWCKTSGSEDVFRRDQPKSRDSIQWIDSYAGDVHTLIYKTISNQLSAWRGQGIFPQKK